MAEADQTAAETSEEAMIELLGELYDQAAGESLDQHVESAVEKLTDDDLIGFGLVAIRHREGTVESASQRVVDPATVRAADQEPEAVINAIHAYMCQTWDQEVRDR